MYALGFSVRRRSGKRKVGHRRSIVTQLRVIGVIEIESDVGETIHFFSSWSDRAANLFRRISAEHKARLTSEKNSINCPHDVGS